MPVAPRIAKRRTYPVVNADADAVRVTECKFVQIPVAGASD